MHNEQQSRQQHGHMDPDKMFQQLKKLRTSLDLTQQRLTKSESEAKELRGNCATQTSHSF